MAGKPGRRSKRRWSRDVTLHSNALDLEPGVFKGTPAQIARSLQRSAERSTRRKAAPFRSAMSMLVFFQNRAGTNLPASRKRALDRAKDELRKLYGRPVRRGTPGPARRRTRARSSASKGRVDTASSSSDSRLLPPSPYFSVCTGPRDHSLTSTNA